MKKIFTLLTLTLAISLVTFISPAWAKSLTWSGRVDGSVNIVIQGRSVKYRQVTGAGVKNDSYRFKDALPPYFRNARLEQAFGRGKMNIISQRNGQVIVHIQDWQGGGGNYRFTLHWDDNGGNGDNPQMGINTPANSGGSNNGNGGANTMRWQGQVEGVEDIHIVGGNVTWNLVTGTGSWQVRYNLNGRLPARAVRVRLNKRQGRGNVYIVEQPTDNNNFICTIRIVDKAFGAGQYDLLVSW